MQKFFRTTALAALLLAALPAAQAATQNYIFSGTLDSGIFSGQAFSGSFSFDDAALTSVGSEWLGVGDLSFSFLGHTFTLSDAAAPAEVGYFNGNFLGLSFSVESSEPKFSLIAGYENASEAFIAYDTSAIGGSGAGSLIYAAVPEPESYALLLAGLGLMGAVARRRAKMA